MVSPIDAKAKELAADLRQRIMFEPAGSKYILRLADDSRIHEVLEGELRPVLEAFTAQDERIAELERERDEWRSKYNRLIDLRNADTGGQYVMECEWEKCGFDLKAAKTEVRTLREALPIIEEAADLQCELGSHYLLQAKASAFLAALRAKGF